MITTLDHVQLAMPVGREQEARSYHGGLLGLVEFEKALKLQARGGVWFILGDGRQIHLVVEPNFRPSKNAHPCLVTDEYSALIDRLEAAGYDIERDAMNPPASRFHTHDIFSNRLEFVDNPSASPN
jgi:hypothetical protein